ncbi:MAG: helix-turn-helix domain-containing protein [Mucilaginibacter sp.]
MNLKAQLTFYLELRNMTAAELSRKSGVSKQVISQWLSGAQPKKLEQVKKVASVLGTSIDHLCFGSGKDIESQKITEIDALLGNQWISGLFEVRLRRVRKNGDNK